VQALAGLAVAGGLVVTYRTYRQNQVEQERSYRQRLAEERRRQAEQDRTYERELYAQAVEQLGHEQAPVRLGALYSLESLAQDQPQRRQTVVDVLCAYLRMPYTPPARPDSAAEKVATQKQPTAVLPSAHDPAQELQVRQTVQRLLATHLRQPPDTSAKEAQKLKPSPDQTFWPRISLDLSGANLVRLNLANTSIVKAKFDEATFTDTASFDEATFTDTASFDRATFTHDARFDEATFTRDVWFGSVAFTHEAWFDRATFTDDARFDRATFTGFASFVDAKFIGYAGYARFDQATFTGHVRFDRATFAGPACFDEAKFTGAAWFNRATFANVVWFRKATFTAAAWFGRANFTGGAGFEEADVLHLDDQDLHKLRPWPPGWTVRPNPADPSRGTLERVENAREQPTTPPA
jgi:uncharacterized protein YjbI with pentapeptide repeats